mgnify:CR=1 FL=1|tara:strand:+ start:1427 stop:2095 length:669 start_codon:yes stop_codon:yes gene_type:complete
MADSDFTDDEVVTVASIIGIGLLILVVGIAIATVTFDFSFGIDFDSWGFTEWSSAVLVISVPILILAGVYFSTDSDVDEDGGVFQGYGFALTVIAIVVGILAIQTQFFGLIPADPVLLDIDGDGNGDIWSDQVPDGYVDYGTPQPYGFGNYGPEDDGLLTGGQGALAGCATTAGGTWLAISWIDGPLPFADGVALAGGCLIGGAIGYSASEADFDGDPTTGW